MKTPNPTVVLVCCGVLLGAVVGVAALTSWTAPFVIGAGAIAGVALASGSVVFGRSRRGQQYLKDLQSRSAGVRSQPKTLADVVRQATTPPDKET